MTLLYISKNQSLYETQTRSIPFIPHSIKVLFIQMPYMKISPQNPPGNKINIIFIFIVSEQICKKDIFIPSSGMLCTDWWASSFYASMAYAEMQNKVRSLSQPRTTCWHRASHKLMNIYCFQMQPVSCELAQLFWEGNSVPRLSSQNLDLL